MNHTTTLLFTMLLSAIGLRVAKAQEAPGSIRGVVYDKDSGAPLSAVQVSVIETGAKLSSSEVGAYLLAGLKPGKYTLIFAKDGYVKQVKTDVLVVSGQLAEADVWLDGEVAEMDEFIVDDSLSLGKNNESGLLQLRLESPALMDSISADLISRAGASDAAGALRLVAGASVQDGKSAVIRGLPDRYVSSQLNGVRLPTADENKRAVELDQFPASVIESVQVSKTFTPDQQGDASGGAVDVRLKGIPKENLFFKLKSQISFNTQSADDGEFLTYRGGGLNFLGDDERPIPFEDLGGNWEGAVGVLRGDAPTDHKWSFSGGGRHDFGDLVLGGSLNLFYERDSSFFDNGIDDSYLVESPGAPLTPEPTQGTPSQGDFKTSLFDITKAKKSVQWGSLFTLGVEIENHSLDFAYLYSRTAEDTTTLAEDTRGKQYYFPGHDPNDPLTPGHDQPDAAPYIRLETLNYTERTTDSFQLRGRHVFPTEEFGLQDLFHFRSPELDWFLAFSSADLYQPDKRQFGTAWYPERVVGPLTLPAQHRPFKPAANFNLGNFQRNWKEIDETSDQFGLNIKLPYTQWTMTEGYIKAGVFSDSVKRTFDQDSFSNFNDNSSYDGPFEDPWSAVFPFENHAITESDFDVDYQGTLDVTAAYLMNNLPIAPTLHFLHGFRLETTEIEIINTPEASALWFPQGSIAPTILNPGDGDASVEQTDLLPALALDWRPMDELVLRGSYSQTIARQTFKELTPVIQQEFLGGPIFIGNPDLQLSSVENFDLRADYTPYPGALITASWFRKDIENPIEYVQRLASFTYTTPLNYPKGRLSGFEFEVRQDLGHFFDELEGLTLGANATIIDSEVQLPDDEIAAFELPNILAPIRSREMTNAPEHLFNVFATYNIAATDTSLTLFYTLQGDTLIAGAAAASGFFVPSIYAREYDTLNFSLNQRLGEHFQLQFQAKNLTNPEIETVYRSKYTGDDVRRSSFTDGIELSLSLSAEFKF